MKKNVKLKYKIYSYIKKLFYDEINFAKRIFKTYVFAKMYMSRLTKGNDVQTILPFHQIN